MHDHLPEQPLLPHPFLLCIKHHRRKFAQGSLSYGNRKQNIRVGCFPGDRLQSSPNSKPPSLLSSITTDDLPNFIFFAYQRKILSSRMFTRGHALIFPYFQAFDDAPCAYVLLHFPYEICSPSFFSRRSVSTKFFFSPSPPPPWFSFSNFNAKRVQHSQNSPAIISNLPQAILPRTSFTDHNRCQKRNTHIIRYGTRFLRRAKKTAYAFDHRGYISPLILHVAAVLFSEA